MGHTPLGREEAVILKTAKVARFCYSAPESGMEDYKSDHEIIHTKT